MTGKETANKTRLGKESDKILEAIKEELNDIKDNMRAMKDMLSQRDDKICALETEVCSLKTDVLQLTTKITTLEDKIDSTEAYERRDTIIISGAIKEFTQGEITRNVAIDTIKEKLGGLIIQPSDISVAHRLQSKNTTAQGSKPPNIYVKLCRRDLKRELIYASKQQPKDAPNKIYINESLTPQRNAVLRTLLRMRKSHDDVIMGVTSLEGQVYTYTPYPDAADRPPSDKRQKQKDVRHRINTRAQLEKFCRDYLCKPLEDFVETWPAA